MACPSLHAPRLSKAAFCATGHYACTTMDFAAVPDHVRLPGRFFGRFTTAALAALGR
ncbi:hypothetical protein [Azorhizobium doebereinerae]|uniref:hypothetical protein n=1 Tax=Azorhizobium doebereinerae TaxID=281091 RepID=UPI000406D643|nr:hypothetical protein [Azorhizobium doebereinerae]